MHPKVKVRQASISEPSDTDYQAVSSSQGGLLIPVWQVFWFCFFQYRLPLKEVMVSVMFVQPLVTEQDLALTDKP